MKGTPSNDNPGPNKLDESNEKHGPGSAPQNIKTSKVAQFEYGRKSQASTERYEKVQPHPPTDDEKEEDL